MIKLRATHYLFCVGVLVALNCIAGELQRSLDDYDAQREFDLASSAITKIHSVLENEMKRLMFRQPGPPSPDVQTYVYTENRPPIDISNLHVPLHLRLIERERREAVVSIAVAKSLAARTCDKSSLPLHPDKYLDSDSQQRVMSYLQCQRERLNQAQAAQHKLLEMHEASALKLHLPPYTENQELTRDREATAQQDAETAQAYAGERKNMQATEDLLSLLKAHAAEIHSTDGHLVFDDPAVGSTAQNLINQMAQPIDQ